MITRQSGLNEVRIGIKKFSPKTGAKYAGN